VAPIVLYALVRAWSTSLVTEHHTAPNFMDEGITPALPAGRDRLGSQSARRPPKPMVIDAEMEEWN
jgi:hypothetical protein